jgi:hypothetical protein
LHVRPLEPQLLKHRNQFASQNGGRGVAPEQAWNRCGGAHDVKRSAVKLAEVWQP